MISIYISSNIYNEGIQAYHINFLMQQPKAMLDNDQQLLAQLIQLYGKTVIIDFVQNWQPKQCVSITQYSLRSVNKKLRVLEDACEKLVIKWRGHDADVLGEFTQSDKKLYIKGYGQLYLPHQLNQFPRLIAKLPQRVKQLTIYFPYLMFEHEIYTKWNEILKTKKTVIICQEIESRANFDENIKIVQESWRSQTKWPDS